MNVEMNEHGELRITPDDAVEAFALRATFAGTDPNDWRSKIVIDATWPRDADPRQST